jgi:hypothetical protein
VTVPVDGLGLTGVLELVEVLLLAVTVVTAELEVVPDAGALGVVLAATFVPVVSEVRSIKPTFGDTRLGVESEAMDAVPELLAPSPAPQAARPNPRRAHSTTLRMSERTAKADVFIDHYPG